MRRLAVFHSLALAGLLAACGGDLRSLDAEGFADLSRRPGDIAVAPADDLAVEAPDQAAPAADLASPPDLAVAAGYPPGPYGNQAGAVIAPLTWEGYVNEAADAVSTTKPFVAYSMEAVRKSGKAYAFVHVAEFF